MKVPSPLTMVQLTLPSLHIVQVSIPILSSWIMYIFSNVVLNLSLTPYICILIKWYVLLVMLTKKNFGFISKLISKFLWIVYKFLYSTLEILFTCSLHRIKCSLCLMTFPTCLSYWLLMELCNNYNIFYISFP